MSDIPDDPGEAWAAERARTLEYRRTHSFDGDYWEHGTARRFQAGCTCFECRRAQQIADQRRERETT